MSALAQFDLFAPSEQLASSAASAFARADRPPPHVDMRPRGLVLLAEDPAPSPAEPMVDLAGQRAFAMKHLPIWTKRAAMVREGRPAPLPGAERIAQQLELVVRRVASAAVAGDELAALRLWRESMEPHPHPRHPDITVFGGPLMDEARERVEAEIAALEARQ